jgi:hypothetical protein
MAWSTLVEELEAAVLLYGTEDPYVPPPEARFPWLIVALCFFGVYLFGAKL